ncbi:MAG: hypothetical protein ACLTCB_04220 [Merdibacter sp.]
MIAAGHRQRSPWSSSARYQRSPMTGWTVLHPQSSGRKTPQLLDRCCAGIGAMCIAHRMASVRSFTGQCGYSDHAEEFDPRANYDRVGIEEKKNVSILDVEVPKITIPVREGRSMGVIIESAVTNYMLAKDGLDSAKEFEQRVLEFIEKNKEESDAAVS